MRATRNGTKVRGFTSLGGGLLDGIFDGADVGDHTLGDDVLGQVAEQEPAAVVDSSLHERAAVHGAAAHDRVGVVGGDGVVEGVGGVVVGDDAPVQRDVIVAQEHLRAGVHARARVV